MKEPNEGILDDLVTILNKIRDNKVYGSVEIFFEEGEVTQITQRIINKISKNVKKKSAPSPMPRHTHKEDSRVRTISTLE